MLARLRDHPNLGRVLRHPVTGQFMRYAAVGAFNTAAYFGLFNLLRHLGVIEEASIAVAGFTTNVNSFVWNKLWAFKDRGRRVVRQYLLFAVSTAVGIGIQVGVFKVLSIPLGHLGRLGENLALAGAIPLSVTWNFLAYRNLTFRSAGAQAAGAS